MTPAASAPRPGDAPRWCGLAAVATFLACVALVMLRDGARIRAGAAELAPVAFAQKWRGEAALRALVRSPDVLPLYGSSELVYAMPDRADAFFADYPTGFVVAPVGDRGYPIAAMTLGVGSLGRALRGRKVAVSLSGTWFLGDGPSERPTIAAHYSTLQAGDVLLSPDLPLALRRRVARSLVDYDLTRAGDELVDVVARCLARRCAYEPLLSALRPIWLAESLVLRAEDAHDAARRVRGVPPVRRPRAVDWRALEAAGDSAWRVRSSTNPFGIDDATYRTTYLPHVREVTRVSDSLFLRDVARERRWKDLDLLLATLRALGARPLVLTSPLNGAWWDARGVSAAARARVYARLDSATARAGVTARTFEERDADRYFLSEWRSHLSPKGWAVYDRTLDAFYHDSLR